MTCPFSSEAEEALPQAADYRLCDYLLTTPGGADALLADYEQLVLARKCGRTAARVSCTCLSGEDLLKACEEQDGFADKLLEKLKAHSAEMPRLYQHGETMLLPLLCRAEEDAAFEKTALLQTGAGQTELPEAQAEMARLLAEQPGAKTFWLDEKQVKIRRCSVSVTLDKNAVCLRLDAQLAGGGGGTPARRSAACRAGSPCRANGAHLLAAGGRPSRPRPAQGSAGRNKRRNVHNKKRLPGDTGRRAFSGVLNGAVNRPWGR